MSNTEENIILFTKPYVFEGKEYPSLDMSFIADLTAKDLTEAERIFNRTGNFSTMPELNIQYMFLVASRGSGLPIEFFNGLPATEAIKIKNALVTLFFAGGE